MTLLTSCGSKSLSVDEYQNLVLNVLQWKGEVKEESGISLPGLLPSMKKLIKALYCPEVACTQAGEMAHLAEVAEAERYAVIEYKAKICKDEVHPPQQMKETHDRICGLLKDISGYVDSIKISAKQASVSLSHGGDEDTLKGISKGFSHKILEDKRKILENLRELSNIDLLSSLFADTEGKIPGFKYEQ